MAKKNAVSKAVTATATDMVDNVIFGLSNLFNMPVTYEDSTGKEVTVNRMRFTLVSAYNGLAYSLSRQNDWLSSQLDQAREKAKAALYAAKGDEISILNVERAMARLEQIEEEMAAVELLLSRVIAVHDNLSTKKFEYRGSPINVPSKRVDVQNVSVQQAARKLGISLESLPNTDGVN